MLYSRLLLVLVAGWILAAGDAHASQPTKSAKRDRDVVARIGTQPVLSSELARYLGTEEGKHLVAFVGLESAKRMALEKIVNERLLVIEAKRLGLDRDPEYLSGTSVETARWIRNRWIEDVIIPGLDNDAIRIAVDEKLKNDVIEYKVVQVVVEREDEMKTVIASWENGKNLQEIAMEMSIAPEAAKGGVIERLKRDNHYFPPGETDRIFSAGVGYKSIPFNGPMGFTLVQVLEARRIPEEEYDQKRNSATVSVRADFARARIHEILGNNSAVVDRESIEAYRKNKQIAVLDGSTPIISIDGKPYFFMRDLVFALKYLNQDDPDIFSEDAFKRYESNFVSLASALREAEKTGIILKYNPQTQDYRTRELFKMLENNIRESIKISDKERKNYFKKNGSKFKKEIADVIKVSSNEKGRLEKYRSEEAQLGFSAENSSSELRKEEILLIRGTYPPPMEAEIFAEEGRATKIFEGEGHYVYFYVKKIKREKILFEDAKQKIDEMIRQGKVKEKADKILGKLKKEYFIQVYDDVLGKINIQ